MNKFIVVDAFGSIMREEHDSNAVKLGELAVFTSAAEAEAAVETRRAKWAKKLGVKNYKIGPDMILEIATVKHID